MLIPVPEEIRRALEGGERHEGGCRASVPFVPDMTGDFPWSDGTPRLWCCCYHIEGMHVAIAGPSVGRGMILGWCANHEDPERRAVVGGLASVLRQRAAQLDAEQNPYRAIEAALANLRLLAQPCR